MWSSQVEDGKYKNHQFSDSKDFFFITVSISFKSLDLVIFISFILLLVQFFLQCLNSIIPAKFIVLVKLAIHVESKRQRYIQLHYFLNILCLILLQCNGEKPCSKCVRDNRVCSYQPRAKRPQNKTYPTGYIELLEDQIILLRKAVGEIIRKLTMKEDLTFLIPDDVGFDVNAGTSSFRFPINQLLEKLNIEIEDEDNSSFDQETAGEIVSPGLQITDSSRPTSCETSPNPATEKKKNTPKRVHGGSASPSRRKRRYSSTESDESHSEQLSKHTKLTNPLCIASHEQEHKTDSLEPLTLSQNLSQIAYSVEDCPPLGSPLSLSSTPSEELRLQPPSEQTTPINHWDFIKEMPTPPADTNFPTFYCDSFAGLMVDPSRSMIATLEQQSLSDIIPTSTLVGIFDDQAHFPVIEDLTHSLY